MASRNDIHSCLVLAEIWKLLTSTLSHKMCHRKPTTEPKLLILVSFFSGEDTSSRHPLIPVIASIYYGKYAVNSNWIELNWIELGSIYMPFNFYWATLYMLYQSLFESYRNIKEGLCTASKKFVPKKIFPIHFILQLVFYFYTITRTLMSFSTYSCITCQCCSIIGRCIDNGVKTFVVVTIIISLKVLDQL